MKLISFVIPCYRSEQTIGSVVKEIDDTMAGLMDYDHEIILVNDCSPDGVAGVIKKMCEEKPYIFASYAHDDNEQVFPLIKRIFETGYNVWYDEGIEPAAAAKEAGIAEATALRMLERNGIEVNPAQ